jgi:hypothetical protein
MKLFWRNNSYTGPEICFGLPLWFKRAKGYYIAIDERVDGYKVYKLVLGIGFNGSGHAFAGSIKFRIGIGPQWENYKVL